MPRTVSPLPADLFPAGAGPVPGSEHEAYVAERLAEVGAFGDRTLAEHVRAHARDRPDRIAYVEGELRLTWRELDELSDRLAGVFAASGLARGDRVAVLYPDGPVVHAVYLATEKAGLIAVGIGPRAGELEIRHLVGLSGATALVTAPIHRGQDASAMAALLQEAGAPLRQHFVIDQYCPERVLLDGAAAPEPGVGNLAALLDGRALGLGDVFLLNSTSGTTGMPKCVVHTQNRWLYYYSQVRRTIDLSADDVILSLIPAPYGFGIWTAHAIPILLGATTITMARFDAAGAAGLIESEGATVMAAVTTQFIMMLNSPEMADADVSSLRCMYTGGEAIPYQRAAEFEDRTGAVVLNFYGSNETGMLSFTATGDDREQRLTTGGHVVPDMRVRLFDEGFEDLHGGPGQAGCRGPATSLGYYADAEANAKLFSPDGWMLTGDLCTVDDQGYLRVVGRTSDFIIRGGKNVSAAAVEEQVGTHPAVAMAAAIGVPDEVFGERVCAIVQLHPGARLDLGELTAHLAGRGVSKDVWPERLEVLPELPRSSGGKIAKGVLRGTYGVPSGTAPSTS